MSEKNRPFLYIVANLIIINVVTLGVMNLRYPLIGHDYTLALPSLLDTALHYRLNGPTIQWFTPTFGGGMPAFPNPNNMQYSLPALMATILPPWIAVMASVVLYISIGYIACYYFFRKILNLNWTASILGALFFSANGFIITRVATGQLGYFSFTLLPLFLIILFEEKLSKNVAVTFFGLLVASYIYAAGYFIIIIFGLSILMVCPLLFLFKPELFQWKRIFSIVAIGGIIGALISIAKLAASFSFMSYFPRLIADNYPTSFPIGLLGIILQLLGTQSLVALFLISGLNPATYPNFTRAATGTHYGMWELDISLTPVVFAILLICVIRFLYFPRKYIRAVADNQKKVAVFLFLFFIYTAIEFTLAKGFIYPTLRHLPILSSLRGNVRFTGAFIFPLACLAAVIYNRWSQTWVSAKLFKTFILVNFLAVIPLSSYFLFNQDMLWMFYDVAAPQTIYSEMSSGQSFEITNIGMPEGKNTGALLYRTSNLNLYEPVFGFTLEYFKPQVKPGSVWDISDGYYNLTDPTSFVYPELNNNKPFDRFRVADKDKMEIFVKHKQPDWKIPTYQRFLDWVSGLTLAACLLYIITQFGYQKLKTQQ